jgi:hypothetical protein
MRKTVLVWPILLVVLSSLACTITVPGVPVPAIPTLEVGPMQEYREEIPLEGTTTAQVEVTLGTGELTLAAGEPELLFSGLFRTNVPAWKPEVTWKDGVLRVAQPDTRGMPGPGAENEWDLYLAPRVPMSLKLQVGAAKGHLDLDGLALTPFLPWRPAHRIWSCAGRCRTPSPWTASCSAPGPPTWRSGASAMPVPGTFRWRAGSAT